MEMIVPTLSLTISDKENEIKTIQLPRYIAYTDHISQLLFGGRESMPIAKHINDSIGYAGFYGFFALLTRHQFRMYIVKVVLIAVIPILVLVGGKWFFNLF